MDVVGAAHRAVELEQAREEQQRRDAFLLALLSGTLDPAELRGESATFGLDADRTFVPFRARASEGGALAHRVAVALAGDDGLVMSLDRDLAGIAAAAPPSLPGVIAGIGPAARLDALPAAFTMASRALQTAVAFGQEGSVSLADLSIRPAILADDALGEAFAARYLEPLAGLGRLGAELETTLRAWFDHEMRVEDTAQALHLHPNTLRHRLRRFESATATSLRDPRRLVELWWALEHRRLTAHRTGR
jgi:sugar diacid utilization regulator